MVDAVTRHHTREKLVNFENSLRREKWTFNSFYHNLGIRWKEGAMKERSTWGQLMLSASDYRLFIPKNRWNHCRLSSVLYHKFCMLLNGTNWRRVQMSLNSFPTSTDGLDSTLFSGLRMHRSKMSDHKSFGAGYFTIIWLLGRLYMGREWMLLFKLDGFLYKLLRNFQVQVIMWPLNVNDWLAPRDDMIDHEMGCKTVRASGERR